MGGGKLLKFFNAIKFFMWAERHFSVLHMTGGI